MRPHRAKFTVVAAINLLKTHVPTVYRAPWNAALVGFLAGLLAQAGQKERAQKLIATMPEGIPVGMLLYHVVRLEIDAALDWYERAIEQRQPLVAQSASAIYLKPLRAGPSSRK
jgi:hypothetical protein